MSTQIDPAAPNNGTSTMTAKQSATHDGDTTMTGPTVSLQGNDEALDNRAMVVAVIAIVAAYMILKKD